MCSLWISRPLPNSRYLLHLTLYRVINISNYLLACIREVRKFRETLGRLSNAASVEIVTLLVDLVGRNQQVQSSGVLSFSVFFVVVA